jgi:hypothetical protein
MFKYSVQDFLISSVSVGEIILACAYKEAFLADVIVKKYPSVVRV